MIINELKVYGKKNNPWTIPVVQLMHDTTSHSYECDVIIDRDVLYVISHEYDIVVRKDSGLYKIRVFDYTNESEHIHYASDIMKVARIIRNIHVFGEVYRYSYMYEYLLGDSYTISPVLIGCDCIHICIVDIAKYNTVASIIFTRHSDNTMSYRYGGGYGEYKIKSYSKTLYDFLEGWA